MTRWLAPVVLVVVLVAPACGRREAAPQPSAAPAPAAPKTSKATPERKTRTAVDLVLVSIDTLRRDHLPVYGYAQPTSPTLLRLARDSVVFDTAIAQHTNTAPSHATMFTGLYPTGHGIVRNGIELASGRVTLAERLKEKGYRTGGFVSGWSLTRHTGLQRGFEIYDDRFSRSRRPGSETWRLARAWLNEVARGEEPFFLFFHMFEPHWPYDPQASLVKRFLPPEARAGELLTTPSREGMPGLLDRIRPKLGPAEIAEYVARYDAEILVADRLVGQLILELEKLGRFEDALVVVTADHGETLFERAWVTDHGARAYDEQIRVPLVIRLPRGDRGGTRIAEQVEHLDLLPTVLEALGLPAPPELPGRSLVPFARGTGTLDPRPAFSNARPEPERVPEIRAKLTKSGLISSVRAPPYKLIEYPLRDGGWHRQLFDLEKDPAERVDLASKERARADELHALLERWRESSADVHRAAPPVLPEAVHRALKALGYVE